MTDVVPPYGDPHSVADLVDNPQLGIMINGRPYDVAVTDDQVELVAVGSGVDTPDCTIETDRETLNNRLSAPGDPVTVV